MALNNYLDFAEDDYKYFMNSYDSGLIANSMGANAQGICEKYMKHLISIYDRKETLEQVKAQESILRTHSLHKLMKYMKVQMDMEFSNKTKSELKVIDGFYFSCRYPGDESIEIDKESLEDCVHAITDCRKEVFEIIAQHE